MWDYYVTSIFSGSTSLGHQFQFFQWNNPNHDEWQAQAFVTYTVPVNNPDWVEFDVTCIPCNGFPRAYIEIQYEGQGESAHKGGE